MARFPRAPCRQLPISRAAARGATPPPVTPPPVPVPRLTPFCIGRQLRGRLANPLPRPPQRGQCQRRGGMGCQEAGVWPQPHPCARRSGHTGGVHTPAAAVRGAPAAPRLTAGGPLFPLSTSRNGPPCSQPCGGGGRGGGSLSPNRAVRGGGGAGAPARQAGVARRADSLGASHSGGGAGPAAGINGTHRPWGGGGGEVTPRATVARDGPRLRRRPCLPGAPTPSRAYRLLGRRECGHPPGGAQGGPSSGPGVGVGARKNVGATSHVGATSPN